MFFRYSIALNVTSSPFAPGNIFFATAERRKLPAAKKAERSAIFIARMHSPGFRGKKNNSQQPLHRKVLFHWSNVGTVQTLKTIAEGFIGLNFFLNTRHLKCRTDNGLSLLLNTLQVRLVFETFGVNFINIFGAGWSGGEPAVFRDHF